MIASFAAFAEVVTLAWRRGTSLLGATRTIGVICVITDPSGRVLLVRPHYRGWGLPGGFCGRREEPVVAARREIQEESGVQVNGDLRLVLRRACAGHDDYLFRGTVGDDSVGVAPEPTPDSWEIRATRWCAPDALPEIRGGSRWALATVGIIAPSSAVAARVEASDTAPVVPLR